MPAITPTGKVLRNARLRGVTVLTHKQWGSKARGTYLKRRITRRAKRPADTLVAHITVTPETPDFAADLRLVESIGVQRFGSGVSYNAVVRASDGRIGLGQPLDAKGTHTLNDKNVPGFSHDQNYWARAIAFIGMPGDKLAPAAVEAIAILVAAMIDEGELNRGFDFLPHSAFAFKDCPTDTFRDALPAIRDRAIALVDAGKPAKPAGGSTKRPAKPLATARKGLRQARRQINQALAQLKTGGGK